MIVVDNTGPQCDVCRRNMHGLVGIRINLEPQSHIEQFALAYPELPNGVDICICYVCWLRSMGIEIPTIKETT